MSGIAGIFSLAHREPVPQGIVRRMSAAQAHRGEHEAILELPEIALAIRSRAPIDSSPLTQGESGNRFASIADSRLDNADDLRAELGTITGAHWEQLLPLLWRKHGPALCDRLRGQFALAIWDEREGRLLLARDHFGICPLHWSRQGDFLLFASEIKALLASGMVEARVDLRGIHHVWTFFGVPGPVTCFAGVSAVLPGWCVEARSDAKTQAADVVERPYWQMEFPNRGAERQGGSEQKLVDEFEGILLRALSRRLPDADGVAAYSSGGLDSSLLVSMAAKLRGAPLESYTFRIAHPGREESALASAVAQHVGSRPTAVELTGRDLIDGFPRLVFAAESPVIDVSASALLQLAERVRCGGQRAVITGEGADELQAGYPWFRIQARLDRGDRLAGGLPLGRAGFRAYLRLVHSRRLHWKWVQRNFVAAGGNNAWLLAYMLMAAAQHQFFSRELLEQLAEYVPLEDLQLDTAGLRRWHPLNRSIYLGTRIHLPGLHLAARGDRTAGRSGIETRYPFLDRDVFDFLAPLAPEWKLRGLTDKYLQRRLARRWLPKPVIEGKKTLLHAPLEALLGAEMPIWAEQLLSRESLRATGYFDADAVGRWRANVHRMRPSFRKLFIEMGLVGVISTQLFHQRFFDASLADV